MEGRRNLDARSDVHALGLLLHELLIGVLPLEGRAQNVLALLQQLSRHDPIAPSQRFAQLAPARAGKLVARRATHPAKLGRALTGDLDAIVLHAIARQPQARYGSPWELASDLERHLRYEPVTAREATSLYLMGRFVRRHLRIVVSVALLLMALVAGLVARTFEAQRANTEAQRAQQRGCAAAVIGRVRIMRARRRCFMVVSRVVCWPVVGSLSEPYPPMRRIGRSCNIF